MFSAFTYVIIVHCQTRFDLLFSIIINCVTYSVVYENLTCSMSTQLNSPGKTFRVLYALCCWCAIKKLIHKLNSSVLWCSWFCDRKLTAIVLIQFGGQLFKLKCIFWVNSSIWKCWTRNIGSDQFGPSLLICWPSRAQSVGLCRYLGVAHTHVCQMDSAAGTHLLKWKDEFSSSHSSIGTKTDAAAADDDALSIFKPPPPVGAGGGYMFSGRPCVRACVRACIHPSIRDSRGSFMFPRYLQYLLTDFRQTFVTGVQRWTD